MALPLAKYARGDDKDHSETILDERAKHEEGSATEHSETIIDARGLATQPSDEGKPARIPIVQVAFNNGVWWSIPSEMSAALYAKCEAGEDAGYTWDWGDSWPGSWKPDGEKTSINRYVIDFVHKRQKT